MDYDLIVIGGGSGGLTAAIMAGEIGAKVLLVDRESLGGDCLHWGCVPSKALIASARRAHQARHASDFGVKVGDVTIDFAAVMVRLRRVQAFIGDGESPAALEKHGVDIAFGGARFVDANTITVGSEAEERTCTAKRFVIATGSHASPPPIEGLEEAGFWDHVRLFESNALPARLVVVGAGPIGVEMGQALARLGSEVTILQRGSHVLHREEPAVSELIAAALREEGITLHLSCEPTRVSKVGDEKHVVVRDAEGERTLVCDEILVAVGRRPNVASLNLEAAGVEVSERGVVVDDALRTCQPHIYAVGDVNGGPQFTHWAEHEARVATRNALFAGTSKRDATRIPWCTFCDPEVARVGLTEAEARAQHEDVHVHEVAFEHVDRAVCEGHTRGFTKVVVDGKDRILGVHIVGPEAGEILTEWVLAMDHGISLEELGSSIHLYPALSRVNRRVADERFFHHGIGKWTKKLFGQFEGRQ